MLSLPAFSINRIFSTVQKKSEKTPREIPGNRTATLRALSDLGESVASSVHAIYSPIRLYLCVAMEPKPDALSRQHEADRKLECRRGQRALGASCRFDGRGRTGFGGRDSRRARHDRRRRERGLF